MIISDRADFRRQLLLGLVFALPLSACDKRADASPTASSAAEAPAATPTAAPAEKPAETPAAGKNAKCKQAAEHKAKLKDPAVDPNTLGSVSFDIMDCESGKWSAGKADCILGAKDYATAKQCE